MNLDLNKILKQVLEFRKEIQNNEVITKDQYKEKYNYLSEKAPTLFDMVYKDEGPYLEQLNFMLINANKIKKNEVSQYDADVKVGQKLADEYIYPNIDMSKEK